MRKNLVISRKLSHNLEGWYGYHISKNSKLYKYNFKENNWMIMMGTISRGRIYHILRSPNRRIRIQASRLVALAWIPNPDNKPCVCHKASRMRYRLSRKLVNDLILDKEEKGFTNRELSKKYKISKACVSHYLNRYKPKI